MVELVDTPALGAGAARREGSSPFLGTTKPRKRFFADQSKQTALLAREDLKPFSHISEAQSAEEMGNGYCASRAKDSSPGHKSEIKKSPLREIFRFCEPEYIVSISALRKRNNTRRGREHLADEDLWSEYA